MVDFLKLVKENLTQLPYPVGSLISNIPYSLRPGIGSIYRDRRKDIDIYDNLSLDKRKEYIFIRAKEISVHAYKNVPFYQDIYNATDVNPEKFTQFSDLEHLPIVNKDDFQKIDLEYRSFYKKNRYLVNTGGSSGKPLELYIEPSSIGHEWAHIHTIWERLDFKQNKLKIAFGGRANIKNIIIYDSARHQINVDIYSGWSAIADALAHALGKYNVEYLHGYPSAIFDFILWLQENNHTLLPRLQHSIKGMFIGSEYPSPLLRKQAEDILKCRSVSWYGHTERAVLAYEKDKKGVYYPFFSYGFAEAIKSDIGFGLISTSYYNVTSPLIRYNTDDYISPSFNGSLLKSFVIEEGRSSDYILDEKGNKIFLTALIFGRHHEIFNHIKHIQVHQPRQGYLTILLIARSDGLPKTLTNFFDDSNVKLIFDFKKINTPYRTISGKVPLLVKEL